MSTAAATSPLPGLPIVNQALEPAWVRTGTADTQRAYATALSFEEMLVQQLSQSLSATSGMEGEGEEGQGSTGSDPGASELSSMLPQTLAAGVMSAGGLGMAAQLTRELEGGLSGALTTRAQATAPRASVEGGAPALGTAEPTGGTIATTGGAIA